MRAWWWLLVAASGWGIMLAAYVTRARPDPKAPWTHGLLVVGPELPADLAGIGQATRVRVRLVTAVERTETIIKAVSMVAMDKAIKLALELRPKIILMPLDGAGIDASALQSGHLPEAGRDQIIAGASAAHQDRLPAGERDLEVVGVLKPGLVLMRNAYLIPPSDAAETLFRDHDPSVHAATLVQLTEAQVHDRTLIQKLERNLPTATYTVVMPTDRLEPGTSYLYLGGLAAFLLGGSGVIIGIFRVLATRSRKLAGRRRYRPGR